MIQKFWGTFCAPTILEFFPEKGEGLDRIQKFLDTFFSSFFVDYDIKSYQTVPENKQHTEKCSKSSKINFNGFSTSLRSSAGSLGTREYFEGQPKALNLKCFQPSGRFILVSAMSVYTKCRRKMSTFQAIYSKVFFRRPVFLVGQHRSHDHFPGLLLVKCTKGQN